MVGGLKLVLRSMGVRAATDQLGALFGRARLGGAVGNGGTEDLQRSGPVRGNSSSIKSCGAKHASPSERDGVTLHTCLKCMYAGRFRLRGEHGSVRRRLGGAAVENLSARVLQACAWR